MKTFTNIEFPKTLKISSDGKMIPLEFFGEVIPLSKKIQLKLGYFNTNAISALSYSFAQFIFYGGSLDILTNHFLEENDFNNLILNNDISNDSFGHIEKQIINDMNSLESSLSKKEIEHFYNCLRYLIKINRLKIVPVRTHENKMSHYKEGLFWDSENNIINITGSCNFTYSGILTNGESFDISRSWGAEAEIARIEEEEESYIKIFSRTSDKFIYLNSDDIKKVIYDNSKDYNIDELLEEEKELLSFESDSNSSNSKNSNRVLSVKKKLQKQFEEAVEIIRTIPHFPRFNGKVSEPREYQKEAYSAWEKNNYSGVFAMATGTGKTITSLNCLLNIYNEIKSYHAIILVPSIALLNQWEEEVLSFNFKNILKVGGGNNWEKELSNYSSNFSWGLKSDLVIISTYGSFVLDRFQKLFKKIQKDFLLIADEAHNMGANNIKSKLKDVKVSKKIGLSATPKRIYDPEGTFAIDEFFKDTPPYTYSFGMEKALEYGFLTGYKYYPIIVELTSEEFEEYTEISKKLLKYFDFEKGVFKDDPIVEMLLLKRKNIIHKASNKINVISSIVSDLIKAKKNKFIFAYIPEGYTTNEEGDSTKILNQYLKRIHRDFPKVKMNSYTSEDQNLDDILRGFEEGKIEILFAMKMLDEGVDIPRAEVGIFASSTGNPRQFIQRRGRLLRKHKDKSYATIYDMVVIPRLNNYLGELQNIERNLVQNELNRVAYFASLSMNFYDSKEALNDVCKKYQLDLDTIINDL